jgi:lysozyme
MVPPDPGSTGILVQLVRAFEGCCLTLYRDVAGRLTIGWGHLVRKGETFPRDGLTQEAADELLTRDLVPAWRAVLRLCPVPLSGGQRAALASFTFNLGAGTLQASTLRQLILRGELAGVPAEMRRYCHAGGRVVRGLARRRAAEAALFASS